MRQIRVSTPIFQKMGDQTVLRLALNVIRPAFLTLALACAFTLVNGPLPVLAQSGSDNLLKRQLGQIDEDTPLLLQADEVVYDNQRNRVTAKGNVEIYYNNYTLLADKVIYDQAASTLNAEGNVRIKEPSGAVINAERITLTDDFKEGFIRSLKIVSSDDTRIGADRAVRLDENTTIFEKGVFTPCKACEKHPEKAPLWRIKAGKITHKKAEGNLYYEDASFEFFGVPVAYLPYFVTPDPSVKRRSGFLFPKYEISDQLGFQVETPYFYNMAPNYDLTFSPRYTEKQGLLAKGEWRHRLANGAYNIKLAGIQQTNPEDLSYGSDREVRGSVESVGTFDLGSWWNFGWDVTADSDDTFRRFYKLDNIVTSDRVSKVYLVGQHDRNYFEANLYKFGGLLSSDTAISESQVHPVIDSNYVFGDPVLGGELSLTTNVLSLSRDDGADTNRLITELAWRRTLVDALGQVYEPFFKARGDLYKVSNVVDPITGVKGDEESFARAMGTAGITYSYPFVAHTAGVSHVVEPVGQIIARPNTTNETNIPNEDAQSLVFDDTLLFDVDKFSGYDQIETGMRANVGIRYTMQFDNGGYVKAVAGQSYHLSGDNAFSKDTGLAKERSDYVGGLYFEPIENVTLIGQARFDENDFDVQRTDLYALLSYGPFSGSLNYANLKAQPSLGIDTDRQEFITSATLQIVENWSVFGSLRYDLEAEQYINNSVGVQYADECFLLAVSYNESFIRDRDIDPNKSVMVRFHLKHIGGGSFGSNVDDLIADSDDAKS